MRSSIVIHLEVTADSSGGFNHEQDVLFRGITSAWSTDGPFNEEAPRAIKDRILKELQKTRWNLEP